MKKYLIQGFRRAHTTFQAIDFIESRREIPRAPNSGILAADQGNKTAEQPNAAEFVSRVFPTASKAGTQFAASSRPALGGPVDGLKLGRIPAGDGGLASPQLSGLSLTWTDR